MHFLPVHRTGGSPVDLLHHAREDPAVLHQLLSALFCCAEVVSKLNKDNTDNKILLCCTKNACVYVGVIVIKVQTPPTTYRIT